MPNDALYQCGVIAIDDARHVVTVSGDEIMLTASEYRLLRHLVQNAGRILSQSQLMTACLRYAVDADSRTITTHLVRLRKKLGSAAAQLKSVREFGYKLEDTTTCGA